MKNCPNCGAPLVPYSVHCAYCGTYYYDLTAIDCSKPCFVKFKTTMNGKECAITALALPSVEEVSQYVDYIDVRNERFPTKMIAGRSVDIKANFTCIVNPEDNTLFKMEL